MVERGETVADLVQIQPPRPASARISSTPTGLTDPRTAVRSVVPIAVHRPRFWDRGRLLMGQVEIRRRPACPRGGLWREADLLKLWAAQAISALGSRIARTALPILAVLSVGAGADEVALLSAVAVAPGVLVGLAIGGRVDRRAKRPLLIGADLVRAGLLLTLPLVAWLGRLGMGQ